MLETDSAISVTNIISLSDRRRHRLNDINMTSHKNWVFERLKKRWSDSTLINIWNYSFQLSFYSWCQSDIKFYQRLYQNDTCTQWILLKYKCSQGRSGQSTIHWSLDCKKCEKIVLKCQNETEIPARIFKYATNMNGAIH